MHNNSSHRRPTGRSLKRSLVGGLLAGIGVFVAMPARSALACDISAGPSIDFADLPAVLESGGSVIDPGEFDFEAAPQVDGAFRIEVVEVTPGNDEYLSGSIIQPTNVWGDTTIGPMIATVPVLKTEASDCDAGGGSLGSSSYYLSTANAGSIGITGYSGSYDSEVDAALDELFGPSTEVTDEMAEAATPGGRPDISRPGGAVSAIFPESRLTATVLVVIGIATILAVGAIALLLVRRTNRQPAVHD